MTTLLEDYEAQEVAWLALQQCHNRTARASEDGGKAAEEWLAANTEWRERRRALKARIERETGIPADQLRLVLI